MNDRSPDGPPPDDLARQLGELKARLEEAEQTLDAIRNGDVDAAVVGSASGQLVYTLENADRPYRVLIEQMQEGAVTLSEDGTVLYCNQRFATIVGVPRETILGVDIERFFGHDDAVAFIDLLGNPMASSVGEFSLRAADGRGVPVNISLVDLQIDDGTERVICGVVTDLTHNRRRTEELGRRECATRRGNRRASPRRRQSAARPRGS